MFRVVVPSIEDTLQSLFIWIFYLFQEVMSGQTVGSIASILIHLDFLSIQPKKKRKRHLLNCFNPYSSGFSIYLNYYIYEASAVKVLQSLFTWIFYLFDILDVLSEKTKEASILIHLDFLSIQQITMAMGTITQLLQSLFTWIFYLFGLSEFAYINYKYASILIHLDFLSI